MSWVWRERKRSQPLKSAEEDERQSRVEGGDQTGETKPKAGDREASLGFRGVQAKEQAAADHRCWISTRFPERWGITCNYFQALPSIWNQAGVVLQRPIPTSPSLHASPGEPKPCLLFSHLWTCPAMATSLKAVGTLQHAAPTKPQVLALGERKKLCKWLLGRLDQQV